MQHSPHPQRQRKGRDRTVTGQDRTRTAPRRAAQAKGRRARPFYSLLCRCSNSTVPVQWLSCTGLAAWLTCHFPRCAGLSPLEYLSLSLPQQPAASRSGFVLIWRQKCHVLVLIVLLVVIVASYASFHHHVSSRFASPRLAFPTSLSNPIIPFLLSSLSLPCLVVSGARISSALLFASSACDSFR